MTNQISQSCKICYCHTHAESVMAAWKHDKVEDVTRVAGEQLYGMNEMQGDYECATTFTLDGRFKEMNCVNSSAVLDGAFCVLDKTCPVDTIVNATTNCYVVPCQSSGSVDFEHIELATTAVALVALTIARICWTVF